MSQLKKAAFWTLLLSIILKFMGFVREAIITKEFGASFATDAFYLSFGFVTLAIALTSSGFNNVFLPLYNEEKKKDAIQSEANANALLNGAIVLFIGLSIMGWLFTEQIVTLFFRKMLPTTYQYTVELTRLSFLFLTFVALSSILDSYLQARRIFVPSQFAKLSMTLFAAVFALLFNNSLGITSLVYGFGVGAILGTGVQFYYLMKSGFEWSLRFTLEPTFKKNFFLLLLPALMHSAVGQINLFIDRSFASNTVEAAVSYLNNASLIVSIPHAILGTTVIAILFTLLSEQQQDEQAFGQTVLFGMNIMSLVLLPLVAGFLVLGPAFVAFVYQRGEFTAIDTARTVTVLNYYLPFLLFQGYQLMLAKTVFALQKTTTILKISTSTIVINWILNYVLVDRFGYPALAVSTSIVTFYLFLMTFIVVIRSVQQPLFGPLLMSFIRISLASIGMSVSLYFILKTTGGLQLQPLFQLVIYTPSGIFLYLGYLWLVARPHFYSLIAFLKRAKTN